ncbi:hypothetical protein QG37_04314 [Candidozyma auris]|uniref:Uncharacterized protein n=1 Tax=Candidozyma auris TaxID=498019 RepID=A0A0L0NXT6_CANAR|nr:hypothetical protein QG37_04314 [[Candida] auris]
MMEMKSASKRIEKKKKEKEKKRIEKKESTVYERGRTNHNITHFTTL